MRDTKAWTFLVVGLVLAILTGVALYGVVDRSQRVATTTGGAVIAVVVARSDIPARTVLTEAVLVTKTYPSELVPPGSFTNAVPAIGETTAVPIAQGQAVVRASLSTVDSRAPTSLVIEKGKVLVAFPTNDPLTTAGLVGVGDRVDLLASVTTGAGE